MWIYRRVLILSVALIAAVAGVGCGGNDADNPAGPTNVHIIAIRGMNGSFSFDPVNEVVTVGQNVAWRNEDSITHALVDKGRLGILKTGNIPPGGTSAVVSYSTSMAIEYYCTIHPTMKGLLSINP